MKKLLLLSFLLMLFGPVVSGQSVVDLSEVTDAYGLYDAINNASGPIEVILNPEVEYLIESRSVHHTLVVRTPHESMPAKIKISSGSGSANFWLGEVSVDSIIFDNVHIVGDAYGTYVFNNGNDYSIGKMAFLNSRLQNLGGVFRGKAASGSIGDFIVDNCVLDIIDEYTLLRSRGGNFVTNVRISNSTFNTAKGIIRASEKINTVTIENVTIYQACDADFWINAMFTFYGGFDDLTFTNVLVGPGLNGNVGAIEDGADTPGNITVTNSYYTSDFTQVEGFELPRDFGTYAGTAADLWADPSAADYTIIDNNFDAKFSTGDPRWIPAQLGELSISAGELSPAFDPAVLSYTSGIPSGTEAVVVTAEATHEGATVSGDGVIDVSSGSGTANIQVLEGTINQTYTIEFTVLVNLEEYLQDRVNLFYNAANDEIVFENLAAADQLRKVEIYDVTGKLLRNHVVVQSGARKTISTSDLQRGIIYILRGTNANDESVYLKFMK